MAPLGRDYRRFFRVEPVVELLDVCRTVVELNCIGRTGTYMAPQLGVFGHQVGNVLVLWVSQEQRGEDAALLSAGRQRPGSADEPVRGPLLQRGHLAHDGVRSVY